MRGKPYLGIGDENYKLWEQKHQCDACEEPFRDDSGKTLQEISKRLNEEKWVDFLIESRANGSFYHLIYKRGRKEGGKNEPSNIQIVCPNCVIVTKIVSARLPRVLVERMDDVIELENSNNKRGKRYGRYDFLNDCIETMVLLDEFNRQEKLMSASGHTILIRPVKKIGGRHEGKWQLVISGPKVEESGKKNKILYSNQDLAEAKQKVATWIGCSVEEVRGIEEARGISDKISEYAKLSVLDLKMRSFRRHFALESMVSENNDDTRPLFELVEKIESDSKDINEIQLRLKEISERSLRMSESVRNLKSAFHIVDKDGKKISEDFGIE